MAFKKTWTACRPVNIPIGNGINYGVWATTRNTDPFGSGTMNYWESENHSMGFGSSIKFFQQRVNAHLSTTSGSGKPAKLTADGVFGALTKAAVKWLQKQWGYSTTNQDGIIGATTGDKLITLAPGGL